MKGILQPGLIDSESSELFDRQVAICEEKWAHQAFFDWFLKYQNAIFIQKLILPARRDVGLEGNLSHTNYSEALHSKFKQLIGKPKDPRAALTGLLKLAESQKRDLTMALVDGGPFKLNPNYDHLRIPASRLNDKALVKRQISKLFFGNPGDTYLSKCITPPEEVRKCDDEGNEFVLSYCEVLR